MGEIRALRLRAEGINDHLGERRVMIQYTPLTKWIIIHYGEDRNRCFTNAAEAENWLDGFAAAVGAIDTPLPRVKEELCRE